MRLAAIAAALVTLAATRAHAEPAYRIVPEIDAPVVAVSAVYASARAFRTQKAYCAPLCDPSDLNGFDRLTAGRWDPTWTDVSNVSVYAIGIAPVVLLAIDEQPLHALNDTVVIAESALVATAAANLFTIAAARPRPFLYGEKAPLADRDSPDASMSFLSSHTAVAFAIATSTASTWWRLHPGSGSRWAVLSVGLAGASLVGTARVLGGRHFPTDAIGGAIVGASIGVLVPALHGAPVRVAPDVGRDRAGVAVTGLF